MASKVYTKKNELHVGGESDLTIEVVILIIFGIFMLLFGLLLFQIHTGVLPYAPDSTYGLFLLLISFQIVTLGKTPFGDFKRSWLLILIGIACAIVGMGAGFIPGYLSDSIRIIVGLILSLGGTILLFELFIRKDKARTWRKFSGVLRHLILACGLVYTISFICGLITLFPGILTDQQTAVILILYAVSFFYLAFCIQKAVREYPSSKQGAVISDADRTPKNGIRKVLEETSLSLSLSVLLMVAVLLTLLGIILILVNLGIVPFSQDGLLGMLLVIFSIQMMALGETPIGAYKRSWLMIGLGMIFTILGVISCIVPGVLTGLLQILLGLLNILGGVILLIGRYYPVLAALKNPPQKPAPQLPILKRLNITQTILNIVSIAFGISMLIPGIMPGLLNAEIIVVNGLLLFVLAYIVHQIDKISAELQH